MRRFSNRHCEQSEALQESRDGRCKRLQCALAIVGSLLLLGSGCSSSESGSSEIPGQVPSGPEPGRGSVLPPERHVAWVVADRVFFRFDSAELSPDAMQTLREQAYVILTAPNRKFTIQGYADERGTREYNIALGLRRASAAKDMLVALGVPAAQLDIVSFGKERPIVLGHNETAWAQNRITILLGLSEVPYRGPK